MVGTEAREVMTAAQTAMLAGLPYSKLRDAVITHLMMAEGRGARPDQSTRLTEPN
jgi:hypothetical protein